jgi:hypothetical protein
MIEIGLISVSVVLGIIGLPIWVVLVMVGVSLGWWGFVHASRLGDMIQAGFLGALGRFALTLLALFIGHGIGFALGGVFHAMMGLR